MNLRQLQYFVAIVDAGSLSRAAQHLGIAQPALSQQMAALEQASEVVLLVRSARGVRPTEAGTILYRHARSITRQIDQVLPLLRATAGQPAGQVNIGLPSSLAARMTLALVCECRRRYPKLRLKIVEGSSSQIANLVVNGMLDIGAVYGGAGPRGLVERPLLRQSLFVFSAAAKCKQRAGRNAVSLTALAEQDLILPSAPNAVRQALDDAFAKRTLVPRLMAEATSFTGLLDVVAAGLGVTVLPWGEAMGQHVGVVRSPLSPAVSLTARTVVSALAPASDAALTIQDLIAEIATARIASGAWAGATAIAPRPSAK
jgi:LysR family nitrogen assimilation transcriptional regulator